MIFVYLRKLLKEKMNSLVHFHFKFGSLASDLKEIIQYNSIMSIVAFMNVFDNNVINNIDEYPRYSPSWSLVENFRMEFSPIYPPEFLINTVDGLLVCHAEPPEPEPDEEEYKIIFFVRR